MTEFDAGVVRGELPVDLPLIIVGRGLPGTKLGVAHLDALTPADWRLSEKNVWRVEQALIDMPHYPLPMGERHYQRTLRRFLDFKASGKSVTRRTMRVLYGTQTKNWW